MKYFLISVRVALRVRDAFQWRRALATFRWRTLEVSKTQPRVGKP